MKLQDDKIQEAYKKMFSVNEGVWAFKGTVNKRINKSIEKGQKAFWSIIEKEFKGHKYNSLDLSESRLRNFDDACFDIVAEWVSNYGIDKE